MTTTTPEQRRHEAPEVGAMIGRMLNALIRRAAEGDTEAVEELQRIEQLAGAATTAGLVVAREVYSLGELAAVTGTSRQNLSQRTNRRALLGARPRTGTVADACEHAICTGMRRCRQGGAR